MGFFADWRSVWRFFNDLIRPELAADGLEDGYRAMAADERREAEALDWSEGLIGDVLDEPP